LAGWQKPKKQQEKAQSQQAEDKQPDGECALVRQRHMFSSTC